jgi:hypothetical protein
VKVEQASKVKLWMPTRLRNGEGCTDREETRRWKALLATNKHLIRSTGVVSTACKEGDLGQWGRLGAGGGVASPTSPERATASLGVGEGHTTDEAGSRRRRKGPLLLVCL